MLSKAAISGSSDRRDRILMFTERCKPRFALGLTAPHQPVLVIQAWAQIRLYRAGRCVWMPTDEAGVSQ